MAWMRHGPRAQGTLTEGTATWDPAAPDDEIDPLTKAALAVYVRDVLDGEEAVVGIELSSWESPDEGAGAELLLSAEGHEVVSYSVVDPGWGEPWVVFASSENSDEGIEMVCEQ